MEDVLDVSAMERRPLEGSEVDSDYLWHGTPGRRQHEDNE